ncbi:MAG: DNA topoisomerase VI subunit B [Candidatus Thorarchaeota archaeon]
MLTTRNIDPDIVELSVSSWFYRNRAIAGFENPARSLYVSVRELLENSLDACEGIGILPGVRVSLKSMTEVDEQSDVFSSEPQTFQLIVRDNGSGIPHESIPRLIGKMLTGTKFQYKQSRGTFGLGGSLALLYGQVTTQKPIKVTTGLLGDDHYNSLLMRLDIETNQPIILEEKQIPKSKTEHGTSISYYLKGDWLRSKKRIIDYFNQTSVMVPYASILFETPDDEDHRYTRLVDTLPRPPREMKPHPRGIDVEMLKQMISDTRKSSLITFMTSSFQRVGSTTASEFLQHAGLDQNIPPKSLSLNQLVKMMDSLETYPKFQAPSSDALSPAGEQILQAGLQRLNPELSIVRKRSPNVYSGHPFIIELGVGYGGDLSSGITLLRFANRIPLLYDERSDVTSRIIRDLNLKNYGLRTDDPLLFLVHICSTKVPYKTVGKEYIANVDVVRREINLGLMDCLRRLGEDVRKKHRVTKQRRREGRLLGYYDFMSTILSEATGRSITIENLLGSGKTQGGNAHD